MRSLVPLKAFLPLPPSPLPAFAFRFRVLRFRPAPKPFGSDAFPLSAPRHKLKLISELTVVFTSSTLYRFQDSRAPVPSREGPFFERLDIISHPPRPVNDFFDSFSLFLRLFAKAEHSDLSPSFLYCFSVLFARTSFKTFGF